MKDLALFPKTCLSKLDEEGINYSVTDEIGVLCTVSLSEQDYEHAYRIGLEEHLRMLAEESTHPEFLYNKNDCVSVWKCQCGNIFQTKHQVGVLDGTDVNFCCKCGVMYDWKGEEYVT